MRVGLVTGVQGCALPILNRELDLLGILLTRLDARNTTINETAVDTLQSDYGDLLFSNSIGVNTRSVERPGVNECRSRWWPYH